MSTNPTRTEATIETDPNVPLFRITREFDATAAQVIRAHTDPELFARWCGPDDLTTRVDHWDARTGGSWAFTNVRTNNPAEEYSFHGSFHEVSENRIVQTFTFDQLPDQVSLETLTVTDLGNGRCRLASQSLVDSFEARDAWIASGMETGIQEGYRKLDAVLANAQ
ncbi:SRPBCC family protein [Granulicoccus phenolivorans]|uniref:SRPBCC family protein n=1 Tax=Granulicoccus phenolivorans TaxID=266854 RepID=UPI00041A7BF7|nr:SRPBCC family protein [Granulicoccus phenolivorans]